KGAVSEAAVLSAQKDERLGALLQRPASKRGKAKALSALAHKLGRAFSHLLHTKEVLDVNRFVRPCATGRPASRGRTGADGASPHDDPRCPGPRARRRVSWAAAPASSRLDGTLAAPAFPVRRGLAGHAAEVGRGTQREQREAVSGKRARCRSTVPGPPDP